MSPAVSDVGSRLSSAITVLTVATESATTSIMSSSQSSSGNASSSVSSMTVLSSSGSVRSAPSVSSTIVTISAATVSVINSARSVSLLPASDSFAMVAAVCMTALICWFARCTAWASSSPSSAAAHRSVVKISSGVPSMPMASKIVCCSSSVSAEDNTVVNGVTETD